MLSGPGAAQFCFQCRGGDAIEPRDGGEELMHESSEVAGGGAAVGEELATADAEGFLAGGRATLALAAGLAQEGAEFLPRHGKRGGRWGALVGNRDLIKPVAAAGFPP